MGEQTLSSARKIKLILALFFAVFVRQVISLNSDPRKILLVSVEFSFCTFKSPLWYPTLESEPYVLDLPSTPCVILGSLLSLLVLW